jgi:tetratricopeptide (TPR) repeat protein
MIFLFSFGWRMFGWPVAAIIGVIDAIVFLSMDEKEFNKKYNKKYINSADTDYERKREVERERYRDRRRSRTERPDFERKKPQPKPTTNRRQSQRQKIAAVSPFKASGIKKFKDYDYEGAIKDFEKVLEVNPRDIAIHFNIACAFSLTENAAKAFEHLDKAVSYGFTDFERIRTHDALAFLRVQQEFETFEQNKFQLQQKLESPKENILDTQTTAPTGDLLEQLNKLGELRKKGLLTEDEFVVQKKKLLAE